MDTDPNRRYRDAILSLVGGRGAGKSVCPSEVARALAPDDWRAHMDGVRAEARVLAKAARLRVTQGHKTLTPDGAWKGPIRLRLP